MNIRSSWSILCGLGLLAAPLSSAWATYIGDLVYCDQNANGIYEPEAGDYGLDGVNVRVVCTAASGAVCSDLTTTTGGVDLSVDANDLASKCGVAGSSAPLTWNPLDPADQQGRWVVDVFPDCASQARPWTCSVVVDSTTVPAGCNVLVTPRLGGPPNDGNLDGDYCDAEDGPFPEGQRLGSNSSAGGPTDCNAEPDPAPGEGSFTTIVNRFDDNCALYNDFGYTPDEPPPPGGEGCTPGYWRNHLEDWPPTGLSPADDFDTTFGVDFFSPDITLDDAIRLGGGGNRKVARHGTAGLLSALHPDVGYPYTAAEVIAFVQSGDADPLVEANELGCEIP